MSVQRIRQFESAKDLLAAARDWHAELDMTKQAHAVLAAEQRKLAEVNAVAALTGWSRFRKVASGLGVGTNCNVLIVCLSVTLLLVLTSMAIDRTEVFVWHFLPMLALAVLVAILTVIVIVMTNRHTLLLNRQLDRRNRAERAIWRPTDEDVMSSYLDEKLRLDPDIFRPAAYKESCESLYQKCYGTLSAANYGLADAVTFMSSVDAMYHDQRRCLNALLDESVPEITAVRTALNKRIMSLRNMIFSNHYAESRSDRLAACLQEINSVLYLLQLAAAADEQPMLAAKQSSSDWKEMLARLRK